MNKQILSRKKEKRAAGRFLAGLLLLLAACLVPAVKSKAQSGAGVSVGHADYTDLYRHYPGIFGVTAPPGTWTAPSYVGVGINTIEHIDGSDRYATLNYAWLNSYVNGRFSVNGEIAYCFDMLTSATGTYVRSSSLAEAGIPADPQKVENVLKMATALTKDDYAFITAHAGDFVRASMPSIPALTRTNSAGQTFSTVAFTPDRAALVNLLKSTNADAQNLKRLLVQCAVWHKMNRIEWMARPSTGNVITTTYIDKETGKVTTSTGLAASCVGIGTVIDFDRMYADGLEHYESEIEEATKTAWDYSFRIGETKTLTGQEAADVYACFVKDGYVGKAGDFTVSGNWDRLQITCVRKTADDYPAQTASTSSNTIYSSKPYDMHTGLYQTGGRGSGQFIATAQTLHETAVTVRVEEEETTPEETTAEETTPEETTEVTTEEETTAEETTPEETTEVMTEEETTPEETAPEETSEATTEETAETSSEETAAAESAKETTEAPVPKTTAASRETDPDVMPRTADAERPLRWIAAACAAALGLAGLLIAKRRES